MGNLTLTHFNTKALKNFFQQTKNPFFVTCINKLILQMYLKTYFLKLTFIMLFLKVFFACNDHAAKQQDVADTSTLVNTTAKELSKQIEKDASNPELYYQRSVIYFNESYLDRSLADIDQAINYNRQNPLYYYFKGKVLYSMNQTLKASDAYEQAIKLKPDYTEAKLKAAELYYVVKEHAKSLLYLNSIIAVEQSNAVALYFKGMNLKELKDTTSAIDAFQSAFENDRNFFDAAMQLGLLHSNKNAKLALEYYSAAIRSNPKTDEAWFARGVLYQTNKKFNEALADYRKVIAINPSNDNAYYNVGYINYETKHFDEALRNWNICIQMNNNHVKAYYMRGLVYELQHNKEDAKLNYDYALQLDPHFELAKEGLNRIGK